MKVAAEPPPFLREHQLCDDFDQYDLPAKKSTSLEEQPWIPIDDVVQMKKLVEKEICCQDLEVLAPRLWIMSTQSSANISPLHHQAVKGRKIVVTEQARLHLVWLHDRIFIKPIPKYLLSHKFWAVVCTSTSYKNHHNAIGKAALGYLRTYRYLIQHESDFRIAQQDDLRLVPKHVSWPEFYLFISGFGSIDDQEVSLRYHYGELRLARLNFYAPLLLRRFQFEQVYSEYSDYFARLYGPVLFGFALLSIMLNCMQVEMAVEQVTTKKWITFWSMSRWFSTVCLISAAIVFICFALLWTGLILDEWLFAVKDRMRKRRERHCRSSC